MRTKFKDIVTVESDGREVFVTIEDTKEDQKATAGFTVDEALRLQVALNLATRAALKSTMTDDIIESFLLAMLAEGIDHDTRARIVTTVRDAVDNND